MQVGTAQQGAAANGNPPRDLFAAEFGHYFS